VTKYRQIEDWLRKEIKTGVFKPGDKIPTETELAAQFSASKHTVRKAVSNLIQMGWLEAKRGSGVYCIDAEEKRIKYISYVTSTLDHYIFPGLIRSINLPLFERGYHFTLNESESQVAVEKRILMELRKREVAGIIITPVFSGAGPSNRDLIAEIDDSGIPVILLDNHFPDTSLSVIAMNDREGGALAVQYLIERGHTKIGVFYSDEYYPFNLRKEGALDGMREKGIEINGDWILNVRNFSRLNTDAYAAIAEMLKDPAGRPTAVFCCNDQLCLQAINAAEDLGLHVPEDLSLIGFDNSDYADLRPISLTSIDHPNLEMGGLAVKFLLEKIEHPEMELVHRAFIKPKIVERRSVRQRT
jgi:GntR family transcriptional regulator, arabinose operon transcriptional repressor